MKIIYSDKISLTSFKVMLALVFCLANCVKSNSVIYRCYWRKTSTNHINKFGRTRYTEVKRKPITDIEEFEKVDSELRTKKKDKTPTSSVQGQKNQQINNTLTPTGEGKKTQQESNTSEPTVTFIPFDLHINEQKNITLYINGLIDVKFHALSGSTVEKTKEFLKDDIKAVMNKKKDDCSKWPKYMTFRILPQDRMLCREASRDDTLKSKTNIGDVSEMIERKIENQKDEMHCMAFIVQHKYSTFNALNYSYRSNLNLSNMRSNSKEKTGNGKINEKTSTYQQPSANKPAGKQGLVSKPNDNNAKAKIGENLKERTSSVPIQNPRSEPHKQSHNKEKAPMLSQKAELSNNRKQTPPNKPKEGSRNSVASNANQSIKARNQESDLKNSASTQRQQSQRGGLLPGQVENNRKSELLKEYSKSSINEDTNDIDRADDDETKSLLNQLGESSPPQYKENEDLSYINDAPGSESQHNDIQDEEGNDISDINDDSNDGWQQPSERSNMLSPGDNTQQHEESVEDDNLEHSLKTKLLVI